MGKLKPNAFKLQVSTVEINIDNLANGETKEVNIPLNTENN